MFAIEHRYPNFIWLAKWGTAWVARDGIPPYLLHTHDAAIAVLDADPDNRKAAVDWLDVCDAIKELGLPILDRAAVQAAMEAQLRRQADQRKLDAMLAPVPRGIRP
jgi:hypothetical protein